MGELYNLINKSHFFSWSMSLDSDLHTCFSTFPLNPQAREAD